MPICTVKTNCLQHVLPGYMRPPLCMVKIPIINDAANEYIKSHLFHHTMKTSGSFLLHPFATACNAADIIPENQQVLADSDVLRGIDAAKHRHA